MPWPAWEVGALGDLKQKPGQSTFSIDATFPESCWSEDEREGEGTVNWRVTVGWTNFKARGWGRGGRAMGIKVGRGRSCGGVRAKIGGSKDRVAESSKQMPDCILLWRQNAMKCINFLKFSCKESWFVGGNSIEERSENIMVESWGKC